MVRKFADKAKQSIADKQGKVAKTARAARDPEQEFKDALYMLPDGRYGVPAAGLKNAAVSACRFIEGLPMTMSRGSFFVLEDADGLLALEGKPVLDTRAVRIGKFPNKVTTLAYRPRFDKWKIKARILYNTRLISPPQLLNLFENAGFSVGLCEYRPEKGGNCGMFEVEKK